MNISNDRFIRTTDDYHVESVQKIFKQLYEQGDIYKGKYVGKYCKPCESFWTETQLKDGKCPDCGRDVVDAERRPTSSACPSTPTASGICWRTPTSWSPAAGSMRW